MKILKQGAWMSNVRDKNKDEITADASYLCTDFEGSICLTIKKDTMEITDAKWSIHRAADPERRGEGTSFMLIGESAYIDDRRNSIKILPDYSQTVDYLLPPGGWKGQKLGKTKVLDEAPEEVSPEWKHIREMYLEAIRGVYQAEYYLLDERNYTSLEDYENHWLSGKPEYCRPYTLDLPNVEDWPVYTGTIDHYRGRDLYNKYIQSTILEGDDGTLTIVGAYNDSFHEMSAVLAYRKVDGVIVKADANMLRVPFRACWHFDSEFVKPLEGKVLGELTKRDMGKIIGGKTGCYHLLDVFADMVSMAKTL